MSSMIRTASMAFALSAIATLAVADAEIEGNDDFGSA